MTNLEKYTNAFVEALNVKASEVEDLAYQSISEWDSVGHMALMATLEEVFDIMLDTEDVLAFSSFKKGKEILTKYNVKF